MRAHSAAVAIGLIFLITGRVSAQERSAEWRLSASPNFVVGNGEVDPFTRIGGMARLSSGRYVVTDDRELRVRVYSRTGSQLAAFGSRGKGPGEFQSLGAVWTIGDTIGTWDSILRRITYWSAEGRPLRSVTMKADVVPPESQGATLDMFVGAMSGGRTVLAWLRPGITGAPGSRAHDRMVLSVFDANGALVRTLGSAQGIERYVSDAGSGPYAFSGYPWTAVVADTVLYTNGVLPEVQLFSATGPTGTPARILRTRGRSMAVREAWKLYDEAVSKMDEPSVRVRLNSSMQRTSGTVPSIGGMIADDLGRLWLKEYVVETDARPLKRGRHSEGGRWHVLDRAGRHLASVRIPQGVAPVAVYRDEVMAILRDEFDVESFAVYRLHK